MAITSRSETDHLQKDDDKKSEETTQRLKEQFKRLNMTEETDRDYWADVENVKKSEDTIPVVSETPVVSEKEVPVTSEPSIKINEAEQSAEEENFSNKETYTVNNLFNTSLHSTVQEDLNEFKENLEKTVEQVSPSAGLSGRVEVITDSTLHCPVVAIIGKADDGKYRANLLLIEKYAKPITPQTQKSNGVEYDVTLTMNHAYDDDMKNIVKRQVKPKGIEELSVVGYMVVFSELDLKSTRTANVYTISSLLAIANGVNNLGSLPLSEQVKAGKELINYFSINPGVTDQDILGLPVASDVASTVILRDKKDRNNNNNEIKKLNDGSGENQVLKVNAILDALFVRPKQVQAKSGFQTLVVRNKPAIFATNIEGLSENSKGVYEDKKSILLALSSLAPLAADGNYRQIFNKRTRNSDKASVGLVGLYANCDPSATGVAGEIKVAKVQEEASEKVPGPLDVFDRYFDTTELPVIGFDAVEGSRMAWAMRDFITAAKGETETVRVAAERRILKAIDEQGDGTFSKKWGDKRIVHRLGIVHYGFVEQNDGNLASIASFDNFQAMAACKGDMNLLSSVAINGPEISTKAQNLDYRLKFYKELVPFKLKLYADRLYFDPEFMVAYITYLIDSKVNIKPEGLIEDYNNTMSSGIDTSGFSSSFGKMFTRDTGYDNNGNGFFFS